jgi:hypothetical protein
MPIQSHQKLTYAAGGGGRLLTRLALIPAYCIFLLFIPPIAAQAASTQYHGFFEITTQSSNSQCVTNVTLSGINTETVSHVILDEQIVWDVSDIPNTSKTLTIEENELNFTISPCLKSQQKHAVRAIFKDGFIASQSVKFKQFKNSKPDTSNASLPIGRLRIALRFIATHITSPRIINAVQIYGGTRAVHLWKKHSARIATKLKQLASDQAITIDRATKQMENFLHFSLKIPNSTATIMANAFKQALLFLL